jgi:hypothetical protein
MAQHVCRQRLVGLVVPRGLVVPMRLLVGSDVHGNAAHVGALVQAAAEHQCDALLLAGGTKTQHAGDGRLVRSTIGAADTGGGGRGRQT